MRAVQCVQFGPPELLRINDIAVPGLGAGQIRIAVHAAGLNLPDALKIQGLYQEKSDPPFVPGFEAAGVVTAVAPDVGDFAVGDRVAAVMFSGALAEQAVVDATAAVRLPDSIDFVTAAGMHVTYGTAMHALARRGRLKAGEVLVVLGAAGGVGSAAVQLGRALGARVLGVAGGAEKCAAARGHGCHTVIDHSCEDVRQRILELTDGRGADVILDPVGGAIGEQLPRCLNWNGRLLVVGFAAGGIPAVPANILLLRGADLVGVFWGKAAMRDPAENRCDFDRMFAWSAAGAIRPDISDVLTMEGIPQGIRRLVDRTVVGKLVARIV